MYIFNGVVYAGEQVPEIKVTEAKPLPYGIILLTFSTGEKRLFDTTLLTGSAFKPLQDEEVFKNLSVSHGVVTWLNGEIDIAPETLYQNSFEYEYAI